MKHRSSIAMSPDDAHWRSTALPTSAGRGSATGQHVGPASTVRSIAQLAKWLVAVSLVCSLFMFRSSNAVGAPRVSRDLLALYTFDSGKGNVVRDRSGTGERLDLTIENPEAVQWKNGAIAIRSATEIRSSKPARKIIDAIRRSNSLTIEAWIKPANDRQSGPARIVSLSADPNQRNFTLGQDGRRYDVRLRTTSTSTNGIPSTAAPDGSVTTALTHVVYTRDATGNAVVYLNGKRRAAKRVAGRLLNWDGTFRLALANELTGDRPWLGELHLVAIYRRALSIREVQQNFAAGARSASAAILAQTNSTVSPRVSRNLLALYTFDSGKGNVVRDRSGTGERLDLTIENPEAVQWKNGALAIRSATEIRSSQPARKIIDAIRRSNSLTIEAWIKPANDRQSGPARIVSLSADPNQRNFTLGQDGRRYDVRLRTTSTSTNGIPSTAAPDRSVTTALTHVVYTRDATGNAVVYLNGKRQAAKKVAGNLSNWNNNYPLLLANELTGDRPWLGELHLVAIYRRSLSPKEIQQNYAAGVTARPAVPPQLAGATTFGTVFDTKIAPLFAKHCLECHDSAIKKGGLDLSRRVAAAAGGESGKVIAPGEAADSLLWEMVASNDMPKDRPPLDAGEKAALKEWLDGGAKWSTDVIDPVLYVHGTRADQVWVQRLTVDEYIATVKAAVGVDIAKEARQLLPPDLRADGFSNTAYNLNIDLKHVEAYSRLAEIIVDRMDVLKFASRFSKSRSLSTDDTMRKQVKAMGKWLLRGPLDEQEEVTYSGIATTVSSAGGDYQMAMRYIIEAMLQSPRFIYRIERQQGDGGFEPLDDYELACRMSYIIWGAPPDEALMRVADKGQLSDRSVVEAQVRRMLKDPRAVDRSLHFVSDWLHLQRLDNMRPNPERFPHWNAQLAADMREETLAYFREVVWKQQRPLADLLNAQFTFATPRLAAHYGLKPQGKGIAKYDVSSHAARGGLLTQGSVLTIGGDDASMVSRGLFVLHDLLRGTINAPPPCVNTNPPPTKAGLTQRGIAEQRIADVKCGVCHSRFEPLAFGLEKFDGLGAFHEKDRHGNTLREDGEILFPGEAKPVRYRSSAELMNLLAKSERVRESLTWKVTQFALGRPLVAADAPVVASIHEAAQAKGGTYASLITAIIMSDLVQQIRTEKAQ